MLMQSTFLGAIVNLVVCALTVSHIGIRGAALGNLLAELVAHAYLLFSFGWDLGLSVLREAVKPIVAGTAAYGVMFATRNVGQLLCPALTVFSYAGVLFIIGGIKASDLSRLRSMLPSRRFVSESFS